MSACCRSYDLYNDAAKDSRTISNPKLIAISPRLKKLKGPVRLVYDQNFYGGGGMGEGVVDGEGGSSERCLKWGGGGSLRDLSKNILKQGVGKGKSCW